MASMAPAPSPTWDRYRGRLETYFDKTAFDAWKTLTTDEPVSRIRATVRAGRDAMRTMLLDWLPGDLTGLRLLDAGCGTGALAVEAARRGATVVAIDISGQLVGIARERAPADVAALIDFRVGDMLDPELGTFDHVVAMDSLIHYRQADIVATVAALAARTRRSVEFTFAPRTPALTVMHNLGKLLPRADRAPAIIPVGAASLGRAFAGALPEWTQPRCERVQGGFYTSQALELVRP